MLINGEEVRWDNITREQLKHLVSEENLSDKAIAQSFGITVSKVRYKRKKFRITMTDLFYDKFESEDEQLFSMLNQKSQDWFLDGANIDLLSKAITNYIFRNGPVEDLHAKKDITQADMKTLNIFMVNRIAGLLTYAVNGQWMKLRMALAYCSLGTSEWYPAEPSTEDIEKAFSLSTKFGMGAAAAGMI